MLLLEMQQKSFMCNCGSELQHALAMLLLLLQPLLL
jgi:hypothetical protein